ncbi:MAG: HD domain-containing protein [Candidatus Thermoplasmatota archaeon]|nr:HD domain-containing protein [Candidatus Thermoplasmatota archaeon]
MNGFEEIFPLIQEIKDEEMKKKVVECWKVAMRRGGWKNLDDVPFTLLLPDAGCLVDHVNRVAGMAYAVGKKRGDVDMDLLITGAVLHDVGKLLEYERVDGGTRKSYLGKILRHPVSGAALAAEVGLNDKVVSIIASHSKEGNFVERIPEGIIVHHCDFIDFEIAGGKK